MTEAWARFQKGRCLSHARVPRIVQQDWMAARPKTPAQAGHRFDPAALRGMAGEKVFARGEAYAREGRVDVLSDDGTWLRARVTGSER